MSEQKIYFLKGLPASGKTSWAKKWVDEDSTNRIRVNKDDLRSLLHNGKYSKGNEKQILRIQNNIIIDGLKSGRSIVIDNTHLYGDHLNKLILLLMEKGYGHIPITVDDSFLKIDPTECIKRDLQRANSVGSSVIWKMYWDYMKAQDLIIQPKTDVYKEDAIIVDVDGTLASMNTRHPFDWSKVKEDSVVKHIRNLVNVYSREGYKIIILSGRDNSCFNDTVDWLIQHDIMFDNVYLRAPLDTRKDCIIKKELYETVIKPKYNIHLVVDDRPQVIRMWKLLGLPVINANPIEQDF